MTNQRATRHSTHPFRKGDRLPAVGLQDPVRQTEVELRPSRGPRVVVPLHQHECDVCLRYVTGLAATRDRLESWGADLLVVSPEPVSSRVPALDAFAVPVLEDPTGIVADGRLSVIIVDEWGEVYFASEPDGVHSTVAAEEVVEWVKFIAIQCPECEGPEGAWRDV